MSGRVMGAVVTVGAVLLAVGAIAGGVGGFIAIGLGYGAIHNTAIVAEARLQDTMSGRARATVTSVVGLTSEVLSVGVFAGFAVGSTWIPLSGLVVATVLPLLVVGFAAGRWLPGRGCSAAS